MMLFYIPPSLIELQPKPVIVKKPATPPPPPPPPVPKKAPRRPSTSVPVIRRNETENAGRPKREIHPPPPKDLPYADVPKKPRRRSVKKDASNEQLRYCVKILDQMGRKQHAAVVGPFAEPVGESRFTPLVGNQFLMDRRLGQTYYS